MKEIKNMFLLNYRNDGIPFKNYVLKGTLWEGTYIPCSITALYSFMCAMTIIFYKQKNIILLITTIIITIQRYYMYKLSSKKAIISVSILMFLVMYFITIQPISWILIYIFPIIYWGKNNIKFAILEIIQDVFCLIIIPYIFL